MNYVSADEAVRLVRSGDTVVCQGGTSVPVILQEALARRHAELQGVQIVCGFNITAGEAPFCKPEYKDSFLVNSIFISGDQRKHIERRGMRAGGHCPGEPQHPLPVRKMSHP